MLSLTYVRATVVLDALRAYAEAVETEQPGQASIADDMAEEVWGLIQLLNVPAKQQLQALGFGRHAGRPQG